MMWFLVCLQSVGNRLYGCNYKMLSAEFGWMRWLKYRFSPIIGRNDQHRAGEFPASTAMLRLPAGRRFNRVVGLGDETNALASF